MTDATLESPIQLHLVLPYKFDPREDHRIRAYLERGYGIVDLQRITDREAVITLVAAVAPILGVLITRPSGGRPPRRSARSETDRRFPRCSLRWPSRRTASKSMRSSTHCYVCPSPRSWRQVWRTRLRASAGPF